MRGENKYRLPSGEMVDALKRVCVRTLPPHLLIHLKRFDFDLETLERAKVNTKFAFPLGEGELDMFPFTEEGIRAAGGEEVPPGQSSHRKHPISHYRYSLRGVLAHTGTCTSGHYYSFIKERSGSGNWFEFNDKIVRRREKAQLPDLCFGGRNNREQRLKNNNAFMLVFDRVGNDEAGEREEEEEMMKKKNKNKVEEQEEKASAAVPRGQTDPFLQQLCSDVGALDLPAQVIAGITRDITIMSSSSVLDLLWRSNVAVTNRNHVFGPDFFQFAWNSALVALEAGAVALKAEMLHRDKKRRGASSGSGDVGGAEADEVDTASPPVDSNLKSSLLLCTQMATSFLLHIFIRSSEVTMQSSTGYGDDVGNSAILSGPGFLRQSSDSQDQAEVLRTLCRESSGHWFAMLEQILAMHEPSARWFLEHVIACGNDYESATAVSTDDEEEEDEGEDEGEEEREEEEEEGLGELNAGGDRADDLEDSAGSSSSRWEGDEEKHAVEVGVEDEEKGDVAGVSSSSSSSSNNQEDDSFRRRKRKKQRWRKRTQARARVKQVGLLMEQVSV